MDHTASCTRSFGLAPQLVPITFDVVQSVCNYDIVLRQGSLDGGELFGTRSLLSSSAGVDLIAKGIDSIVGLRRSVQERVFRIDDSN